MPTIKEIPDNNNSGNKSNSNNNNSSNNNDNKSGKIDINTLKKIKDNICKNIKTLKKKFPILSNYTGTYCYMNSAIQMLYSIPEFIGLMTNANFDNLKKKTNQPDINFNMEKETLKTLQLFFNSLDKEKINIVEYQKNFENNILPKLKKYVKDENSGEYKEVELNGGNQNDSTEFLLNIISLLNFYKNTGIIEIDNFFNYININQKQIIFKGKIHNKSEKAEQISENSIDTNIFILNILENQNGYYINKAIYLTTIKIGTYSNKNPYIKEIVDNEGKKKKEIFNEAIDKYFYYTNENNKYIFILNGLKYKILQNKNKQIIFYNKNYKLLGFIAHHGNIEASGATCGHYVYYYMKEGNMKYISDSQIIDITDNDLKTNTTYKNDYEHPYLLLYERIDNITSSGGGKKITLKKKNKSKTKIKNNKKYPNKKHSKYNKKYN